MHRLVGSSSGPPAGAPAGSSVPPIESETGMADTSKNGVFFDTKNNKVVQSQPEEGVQIVAPGQEITPDRQADIDRYTDVQNGVVNEPETVTTKSVSKSK